jgi:hypothetical protein
MPEPSLDSAINQADLEGWDWFEHHADPKKGDAAKSAVADRGQRVAAVLARLYSQDANFREALDFLLDSTLRRATFTAQLGLDPMQAYAFGVFREGQNSFAMALLKLIAIGRKDKPEAGRDP